MQLSTPTARILVVIPIKRSLHSDIETRIWESALNIPSANPELEFVFLFDYTTAASSDTDSTPWSKVARVRNRILREHQIQTFSHLLWIDADVVEFPPTLPSALLHSNATGISAPMIFIEDTTRFYDVCAFVILGQSKNLPTERRLIPGRNLTPDPPYWPSIPLSDIVPMDSVGTTYLINTAIYASGVEHEDHPAFTDHWSVCARAQSLGLPVTVTRSLHVYHANLPLYGEAWH